MSKSIANIVPAQHTSTSVSDRRHQMQTARRLVMFLFLQRLLRNCCGTSCPFPHRFVGSKSSIPRSSSSTNSPLEIHARDVVVSLCVEVNEEQNHRAADTTCLIPASLRGSMTFSAVFCGELIEAATNGCEDTIKAAAAYMALNRVHSGLVSNIQRA